MYSTPSIETPLSTCLNLTIDFSDEVKNPEVGFALSNQQGYRLHHGFSIWDTDFGIISKGKKTFTAQLPKIMLYPGKYTLSIWTRLHKLEGVDDFLESVLEIEIINSKTFKDINFEKLKNGGVFIQTKWSVI